LRAGRQAVSTWAEDLGRVMETHVASGIELNVLCQLLESGEVSVASHEYKTLLSDQVLRITGSKCRSVCFRSKSAADHYITGFVFSL